MGIRKTIILGYEKVGGKRCPVILCEERKDFLGGMKFYCEYCRKDHLHGIGEGHRIAHCIKEKSPLMKIGYIITLNKDYLTKKTEDIK